MEIRNLNEVIAGLEETVDDLRAWESIVYHGDRGQITAMKNRVQKAVDLLKPVKPIWVDGGGKVIGHFECGVCGMNMGTNPHYCWFCGKAVKWDG